MGLAAVAVLGAFAGSALAADVTLYGVVDTGFAYNHVDGDGAGDLDKFEMKSGQQSGSRFGLKGSEDLGNGLTVGFILENQFDSDTGALKDTFFQRESSLYLQGAFGKVAMGRMGSINQGVSSWGKIGMLSAFGTSWGYSAQAGTIFSCAGMWNNMIAYETPSFAGFKVFAQYAMGANDNENESTSDRYDAIGATYNNGPVAAYLAVDSVNYKSATVTATGTTVEDVDDSLTVTLGGSYDFEVAKVYFGAQYFDEVKLSSLGGIAKDYDATWGITRTDKDPNFDFTKVKGYGIGLSAGIPTLGGTTMVGIGYVDAESTDNAVEDVDVNRYVVSAGYTYPFSKRTNVYGVVAWSQDKIEDSEDEFKPSATQVMFGLRHQF